MTAMPPRTGSPTEWIRIFASRLAQRRPDVCAEEVLKLAIDHFRTSHELPPELAAQQLDGAGGGPESTPGR